MSASAARCERFEREGLLLLERGEALGEHHRTCADCREARRKHERIAGALREGAQEIEPRPGWQLGVLGRIPAGDAGEREHAAAGGGQRLALGLACALAAALLVQAAGLRRGGESVGIEIKAAPEAVPAAAAEAAAAAATSTETEAKTVTSTSSAEAVTPAEPVKKVSPQQAPEWKPYTPKREALPPPPTPETTPTPAKLISPAEPPAAEPKPAPPPATNPEKPRRAERPAQPRRNAAKVPPPPPATDEVQPHSWAAEQARRRVWQQQLGGWLLPR